ncbi:MAG: NUDIX domain-containing protein [Clostridiales bacterium]|nr:NUDIX domain-containing protein [Clostridiales bacterium]
MEKYKTPSAVVVLLVRQNAGKTQILLQKRKNTGFGDGLWDLSCSGHVEYKESFKKAAVRECFEELGIRVEEKSLNFFALVHKRDEECDLTYINPYFYAEEFLGEPKICEQEKCSQIKWYNIDELPADLLEDRKQAITAFLNGNKYIEYGW